MKNWFKKAAGVAVAMVVATAGQAQNSDWEYEATVYLFMPETTVSINNPTFSAEGSLSFSDALNNLDFAFMGAFGASNGSWSFLGDYMYTDLSFGNTTPGPAFSGLNTAMTTQILNAYVAYRVYQDPKVQLDLAGGVRWFSTKTVMTLTPGAAPGRTSTADDSWVDPVIGARVRFAMSDKWYGTGFVDYGGFSSDSETWQVLFTVDYALTENWMIRGGYRYISVDHNLNGTDFKFSQSGPMIGATYRF